MRVLVGDQRSDGNARGAHQCCSAPSPAFRFVALGSGRGSARGCPTGADDALGDRIRCAQNTYIVRRPVDEAFKAVQEPQGVQGHRERVE
jgi:hypothetical protein